MGWRDDQIPALQQTAKDLEFREPIIGNLYRDGGDALAPQLDAFVDAVVNGSMPATPHSHKGMALVENVRWVDRKRVRCAGRSRDPEGRFC